MKHAREYQKTAFERFKDALFFCLNLDCGLGKTFVATMIAKHKSLPTLIIAPANLCKQWREELIEAGVRPEDIFIASRPEETADHDGYWARFNAWLEG